jgi:hypothetical protein
MLTKSKLSSAGRTLVLSALAGALSLGIVACGGSGSSSSTTSSNRGTVVASSAGASGRYQARIAYAKCMRAHGVKVPDLSPSGTVPGGLRALRSSPNFEAANQACASLRRNAFGFGSLSPARQARIQQGLVKFAQCMRAHKIDIQDPTPGPGGGLGIFRGVPSSERKSPAFRSALEACSTNLPRGFGRGAAGAGPSGAGANVGA